MVTWSALNHNIEMLIQGSTKGRYMWYQLSFLHAWLVEVQYSTTQFIGGRLERVHPNKGTLRESAGFSIGWPSGIVIDFNGGCARRLDSAWPHVTIQRPASTKIPPSILDKQKTGSRQGLFENKWSLKHVHYELVQQIRTEIMQECHK